MIKKVHQRINLLFNVLRRATLEVFIKCYVIYIRPLLEYGTLITSPVAKSNIIGIENCQKKFIFRTFKKFNVPYPKYFKSLEYFGLESLEKKTPAARSGLYIQNSGFKGNTNPGRVTK
uniref:Uncharacterized protein n=1 Tax=Caenorhabditis japonica TaxID=281687 RepID=A0A8R1HHM3_CAEJA